MCPLEVVQMELIRYLQQWSMNQCGKNHMGCRGGGGGGGANKNGADQPALLLCLISPIVVRFL